MPPITRPSLKKISGGDHAVLHYYGNTVAAVHFRAVAPGSHPIGLGHYLIGLARQDAPAAHVLISVIANVKSQVSSPSRDGPGGHSSTVLRNRQQIARWFPVYLTVHPPLLLFKRLFLWGVRRPLQHVRIVGVDGEIADDPSR